VLAQVRDTPGVEAASLLHLTPVSGGGMERPLVVAGRAAEAGDLVSANRISPGFFATFGTRLMLGRDFVPADLAGDRPVAIVNAALVQRYFKNETPIGRQIILGDRKPREIVGVVATAKYYSFAIATRRRPVIRWTRPSSTG
jgi:putative ABC transport system permease protein